MQDRESPLRNQQAGEAADERDDDAFGQQLLRHAAAAGADGAPNRQLLGTCGRAREQQRRHVRARDQRHERHGAEQHQQRRPDVADQRVAERPQVREVVCVLGWIRLRQPRADDAELLARLLRRGIVAQPAEDLEEVRGAQRAVVVVERKRYDDVRLQGPPEPRGHHSDDLERVAVELDRAADHGRIGAEAPAPKRVGQKHHPVPPANLFFGAEVAAERRRQPDDPEERR